MVEVGGLMQGKERCMCLQEDGGCKQEEGSCMQGEDGCVQEDGVGACR